MTNRVREKNSNSTPKYTRCSSFIHYKAKNLFFNIGILFDSCILLCFVVLTTGSIVNFCKHHRNNRFFIYSFIYQFRKKNIENVENKQNLLIHLNTYKSNLKAFSQTLQIVIDFGILDNRTKQQQLQKQHQQNSYQSIDSYIYPEKNIINYRILKAFDSLYVFVFAWVF